MCFLLIGEKLLSYPEDTRESISYQQTGAETQQVLRTPEQVALHLPLAGPTSRMLAYAIDSIAYWFLIMLIIATLVLLFPVGVWLEQALGEIGEVMQGARSGRALVESHFLASYCCNVRIGLGC